MSVFWGWANGIAHRIGVEHRRIAKGVVTVALFALLGKGVGAAKEMAIAWRYGISVTVDAYLFVFNLAQWPVALFYGVITSVLVPIAAKIRDKNVEELPRFRAELLASTLAVGFGFGLIAWIMLPLLVRQSWIGLNPSQQVLASRFAPWLAWIIPFGMVYGLLAAWAMSKSYHVNTLLDGLPSFTLLVAVLLAGGITPLIVGILAGFVLQPFSISVLLYFRGELERPLWGFSSPWWRVFCTAFATMLLGQFLQSLVGIVDQFFAVYLGPGELATLGYSNRILSLINALGAMAIGRALLPVLSQTYARGRPVWRKSMQWALLFFLLGGLITILGFLFSFDIVRLLFQRGAFSPNDTNKVFRILRIALLQLPFYFGGLVFVYALLSQGMQRVVTILAGINLFVKVAFSYFLIVHLQQGLLGLIVSSVLVYLTLFFLSFVILFRKHYNQQKVQL